jgi:lysophospholipase L1-like esterase
LTGEVILRLLGHHGAPQGHISHIYPVDDPNLDWRHIPNSEFRVGRVVYTYNSSGFRDIDHVVEKPVGIKRIIVVGDSLTEGYEVEWRAVFSRVIQSQLGDQFEVINIAAGGLNTPQEIHLFEQEGLAYKPDLVILNFVLNDCDFYSSFKAAQRYNAEKDAKIGILNLPIDPRVKRLLKSSALVYFVKERVEDLKGRILGVEETDYFTRIWGRDENRRKVTSGFDKLKTLQQENHFDVLIIIWPLITDYKHYRFGFIHQWVKKEAEKRNFSTIDLLPSFSRIPYRDLQVTAEDNAHPNALGHRIGAEAFLGWYRPRKGAT